MGPLEEIHHPGIKKCQNILDAHTGGIMTIIAVLKTSKTSEQGITIVTLTAHNISCSHHSHFLYELLSEPQIFELKVMNSVLGD